MSESKAPAKPRKTVNVPNSQRHTTRIEVRVSHAIAELFLALNAARNDPTKAATIEAAILALQARTKPRK